MDNKINSTNISDEIVSLSADFAEIVIDDLFEEGILKEIPIIGTLVGIIKVSKSIRERLFIKKILYFLNELKNIPTDKKTDFIKKLNNDSKYQINVEENLLLIIDKLNDYSKSKYIGKLFTALIMDKIDYDTFLKLSNIIDRCYVGDLKDLIHFYNDDKKAIDTHKTDALYNLDVLTNMGISGQTFFYNENEPVPNKKNQYEINQYGRFIVEIIFEKK